MKDLPSELPAVFLANVGPCRSVTFDLAYYFSTSEVYEDFLNLLHATSSWALSIGSAIL